MRRLTAREVIAIWDAGSGRSAVGQALAVVAPCLPGWSMAELAALPLGFRDALLLELHDATFGPRMNSIAVCPRCGEQAEFSLSLADLPPRPSVQDMTGTPELFTLDSHGLSVEYRLPDSTDLDAIAAATDPEAAAAMLARRCVLSASAQGSADGAAAHGTRVLPPGRPGEDLSPSLLDDLGAEMARRQPWADIELELDCPGCGTVWRPAMDVAAFVWAEIESEARRLLLEVDVLARRYGWSERDILDMSPIRRYQYLELTP